MKWNLTYLFKTKEDFLQALDHCKGMINEIAKYENHLAEENSFVELCKLLLNIEIELSKVYQYASLKSDLNKKDVANEADLKKCRLTIQMLNQISSFVYPEILGLGYDKVIEFVDKHPEIEEYRFEFIKLFRSNEHVLDAKSEKLISIFSPLIAVGSTLYSGIAVSDGKSEIVKLNDKTKVKVTQGNYRSLIENSKNEKDRKKIFEAVFNTYEEHKTTYANIYNVVLQANKSMKEARGFGSCLEAKLFNNNIPVDVYNNLIKVASTSNQSLKKYINLRKKYLNLKTYHTYDRFLSLASSSAKYTYEEAKELFFASIAKFPEDFKEKAHMALEEGFVDVMEQDGKRTGAYSSSVMNERPFILLNFDGTLDSVFTIAHEAGHSIHSMYSETQPAKLQDYTIFVAEIASTFNEHVLLDYFLSLPSISKNDKIVMVQKAIDNIVSTFYRQTLFAEYELRSHHLIEENQPINHEILSNIMIKLYKKYYGLNIEKEKVKKYVWAYIPHLFYTPFYVYQYATSFAASFKLYNNVKNNLPSAFDNYLGLLKSGGSKYPTDQAKEAGVDFMDVDTFDAVARRMDELVNQLEKLLNE